MLKEAVSGKEEKRVPVCIVDQDSTISYLFKQKEDYHIKVVEEVKEEFLEFERLKGVLKEAQEKDMKFSDETWKKIKSYCNEKYGYNKKQEYVISDGVLYALVEVKEEDNQEELH